LTSAFRASRNRSLWRLPSAFAPGCMTLHEDVERWTLEGDTTLLRSVGRGQEFVVDVEQNADVALWATNLVASYRQRSATSLASV